MINGKKIRVGIVCGGRSAEHEVSLQSAKNVASALDRKKYAPVMVGIDKDGKWYLLDGSEFLLNADDPVRIALNLEGAEALALHPGEPKSPFTACTDQRAIPVDVMFPILHGTYGEDGTIQGLFELMDVPFVGPGVLGSAVGMDKDVAKRLMDDAGIATAKWMVCRKSTVIDPDTVVRELGLPLFVKPANLGSSVGVHKVKRAKELLPAIRDALRYDAKVLIEECIAGREIECAVLGNEKPEASVPGEVIVNHEFYSYEAKYLDDAGAKTEIPAKLTARQAGRIRNIAIATYLALELEGMARVDFFVKRNGDILVNEVNTIPGFTNISMYPKLWEASGLSYAKLLDRLIRFAIERHQRGGSLSTNA